MIRFLCIFLLAAASTSALQSSYRRKILDKTLYHFSNSQQQDDAISELQKTCRMLPTTTTSSNNNNNNNDRNDVIFTRRSWISKSSRNAVALIGMIGCGTFNQQDAFAEAVATEQVSEEELDALYENPEMPQAPEERSGLVVLRVAEVAQFQEKILRGIVNGDLEGIMVAPMQFVFGTQILLRNSNLKANMDLMIGQEIPRKYRKSAIQNCVNALNTFQYISSYASSIQRDFKPEEMVELADMYRDVRVNLNQLYEYLPTKEKDKYYGYFVAVTEYEKKIAEGTYNPDIDGKLNFDY